MKFWFHNPYLIIIIWFFDIYICLLGCRRILDLLEENVAMKRNLRVPAISRLQKIHNMDIAFTILKDIGIEMEKDGTFSYFQSCRLWSNFTIWKNVLNSTLYAFISAKKVTSRDIVDGHREKTLHLLWTIILKYQVGYCFLLILKLLILVECEEKNETSLLS